MRPPGYIFKTPESQRGKVFIVMPAILTGCGGGGGKPVATNAADNLVFPSGKVLTNGVPQNGASVYLCRTDEAEIAGLGDQYTARVSVCAAPPFPLVPAAASRRFGGLTSIIK